MTDEQLLEYRKTQIAKLREENSKLREDLREGISLRDHFAGLALQGTLARACPNMDTLAEFVYHIADKMIAEREKAHDL
jgi:hypothetical protein